MAKKDNMKLWQSVETTDPKYTTRVNQRGGFTAIGAQYQLRTATETFGPIGYGWGVRDEKIERWEDVGLAVYTAILWYVREGIADEHEVPIHSSIKYQSNGRVDDDFFKKVATDALTKGFSKIGFNADVFMGKFDDNKYVNKLTDMNGTWKKEVSDAAEKLNKEDKESIMNFLKDDSINSKNYKKALTRIEELYKSYPQD
jgi:hypothetical protein